MEKLTGLKKIKTAVFISGAGSNLKNLIKFSQIKKAPISIDLIVSNTHLAEGLQFADQYKIKKKIFDFSDTGKNILILLKKEKINLKNNKFLKKELLRPTKIYVEEILNLIKNNLINGCANITGGGLADNIKRVIPEKLVANIDLSKIKTKQIFKWLKKSNIEDQEMLKTFNCGVGFCLIINPKNLNKTKKFFTKEFEPYVIGKITSGKNKVKLNGKIDWS